MRKRITLVGGLLCWLLFVIILLGVVIHATWISEWDHYGYQLLQPTTSFKTHLMVIITRMGDPMIIQPLTLILCLFLWLRQKIGMALWCFGLQFIGYALVIITKYSILRTRPTEKLLPANGYSFPSGHTFATTIFVFTLLMLIKPRLSANWQRALLTILGFCWILVIMISRVYLRNHFTSDVWAGLLLASGWWLFNQAGRQAFINWLIIKPFYHSKGD